MPYTTCPAPIWEREQFDDHVVRAIHDDEWDNVRATLLELDSEDAPFLTLPRVSHRDNGSTSLHRKGTSGCVDFP